MPSDRRGGRRAGGQDPRPASPPARSPQPSLPPAGRPSLEESDLPLPSDRRVTAFKALAPVREALEAKLQEWKEAELPEVQLIQFHRMAFAALVLLLGIQAAAPSAVPSLWWAFVSQPILSGVPTNALHWFWYLVGAALWIAYAAYHVTQGALLRRTESGWPYSPLQVVGLALIPGLNLYGSYVLFSEATSRLEREAQVKGRGGQAKSAVLGALVLSGVGWGLLLLKDLGTPVPELALQVSQWLRGAAQLAALGLTFWMMAKLIRRFTEEGGGLDPSSLADAGYDLPAPRGPAAPPPRLTVAALALLAIGGGAVYFAFQERFECPPRTSLAITRTPEGQRVLYCEKGGEPNGPWRIARGDGAEQFTYAQGLIAGPYLRWYPDGTIRESGAYQGKSKEGIWRRYSESGVLLSEESYLANVLSGATSRYHANGGKLAEKAAYQAGKLHGKYAAFHENGAKAEEGTYQEGNKIGRWTSWNAAGLVTEERDYTPVPAAVAAAPAPGAAGSLAQAAGLPPVEMAIHEVTEKRLFAGRTQEWWGERLNLLKQRVEAGEVSATLYELTKRRALLNGLEVQEGAEVKVRIAAARSQGGGP